MISQSPAPLLTAEEYIDQKYDFPEGGRWTELHAGIVITFSPPDDAHGNFVRNLSRELGTYAQQTMRGYACFELGLILERDPDTIYCPPACFFLTGERFAESDKIATETLPDLVVEIASTNDRRQDISDRVRKYFDKDISQVWLADVKARQLHLCLPGEIPQPFSVSDEFRAAGPFEEFRCGVKALFAEPEWWTSAVKKKPKEPTG